MLDIIKTFTFYVKYLKPYKYRLIFSTLVAIPIGMLDGAIPFLVKPFFDGLTSPDGGPSYLFYIPMLIVLVSLTQGGLSYISLYLDGYLAQRFMTALRIDAFNKLLRFKPEILHTRTSGHIMVRFYKDPEKIQESLITKTKQVISQLASILSISAVMLYMNWKLALISVGLLGVLIFPMMHIRKKMFSQEKEENKGLAAIVSLLNNTFAGSRLITSFNLQDEMQRRYQGSHDYLFKRMIRLTKAKAILKTLIYLITSIGIAVVLYYGSYLIRTEEMTAGSLVAFMSSMLMLYRPIRTMGDTFIAIQRMYMAMTRYKKMITNESIEQSKTEHLKPVEPFADKIQCQNLGFHYRSRRDNKVLDGINLTIQKGQMVAIVGKSGSGKSTLAELLLGLYKPIEGEILIDGINLNELNMHSFREQVSYVNQDTFLFPGTLKENIRLGKLDASDEEIWQAVSLADLQTFVHSLPKGLDTIVGEHGVMLSGGQCQRLAIARAFLKNAPILILDEATSSLDNETEVAVQQALEKLMAERTIIVIAHRLSTIQNADKIVFIQQGEIVEEGRHEELIQQQGHYYSLFHKQMNQDDLEEEREASQELEKKVTAAQSEEQLEDEMEMLLG